MVWLPPFTFVSSYSCPRCWWQSHRSGVAAWPWLQGQDISADVLGWTRSAPTQKAPGSRWETPASFLYPKDLAAFESNLRFCQGRWGNSGKFNQNIRRKQRLKDLTALRSRLFLLLNSGRKTKVFLHLYPTEVDFAPRGKPHSTELTWLAWQGLRPVVHKSRCLSFPIDRMRMW